MKLETKKEIANTITHGIPLIAFLVMIPILIVKAVNHQFINWKLVGISLFAFGLFSVYTSSTFYHAIFHVKTKRILRIFDHISIYFLIAGSYSAFMFLFFPNRISFPFLIVLWSIVALGIIKKIFLTGKYDTLSTLLYIFLGCMGLFLAKHMFTYVPNVSLWLIFIGGFSYLFGVIFYAWKGYRYHHAVWHVFVFIGSLSHFFGVYLGINA
ncbi:MAG: hemolysin III family protein [Chitinophagales bacterium]|nr:hemolysin III family protein [Chitinophagales bacterium]